MPDGKRRDKKEMTREQQSAAERTGLRILRYVLDHPGATRRDAALDLRLSFPNVCRLVAAFERQGTLVEDDLKQTGKRGPRSRTLALRADQGCSVGIDLESTHIRGIVLDFANEIREVRRCPIAADATSESVVSMVAGMSKALVKSAGEQGLEVLSVGLALPGPVIDASRGLVRTELQCGKTEMEFVPVIAAECGVATYAAPNDICFALGHHRIHRSPEVKMEVLVLNRFGLSAAVLRDGDIYSGHLGLLPFGSETPIMHYRDLCTGSAILRLARERNDNRQFHELMSAPDDPLITEWLAKAAPAFAQAIYSAVMMYSPDRLTIEGMFIRMPQQTRRAIVNMVESEMARLGMTPPAIRFFEGDDLMGARGAAFVARDHIADEVVLGFMRAGREIRHREERQ